MGSNRSYGFSLPKKRARYQTLRNASLSHRILQPFAQEELLSYHIEKDESLRTLLEALDGSDRLASYAQRTEEIGLWFVGNTMQDGLLSRLSEFCPSVRQMRLQHCDIDLCEISKLFDQLAPDLSLNSLTTF